MNGNTGCILRIDLTRGTTASEHPSRTFYRKWLGGRGAAGYFLSSSITRAWNDPEMIIAAFAGPLTGTGAPATDGLLLMSRSPLTGTVGDTLLKGASGTQLKRAGFDGIVVSGRSETLVGVVIDDGTVKIVDASALRDVPCEETFSRLAPHGAAVCIGPAGERGVPCAGLAVHRGSTMGESGLGAVFGAKNLKYIAFNGTGEVTAADPTAIDGHRSDIERLASASPLLLGEFGFSNLGTVTLLDLLDTRRMVPTDNFRRTHFEAMAALNADALRRRYPSSSSGCPSCPVGCCRVDTAGNTVPELEAMSHFTALVANKDMDAAVTGIRLSHNLGMSPVVVASSIACYQEISNRAFTATEMLRLIEDMAFNRGLGSALNHGPYSFAEERGAPETAMTVKRGPLSALDPRGALGTALSMAVATTGGAHRRADIFVMEVLRKPVAVERFTFSGKARLVKNAEDKLAAADGLIACRNLLFAASLEEYGALLAAVIGDEITPADLMKIGERTIYQERIMNAQNGFTASDDDLPGRFFSEPGSSGPGFEVPPIDREAFLDARRRYYLIRGLDADGGPTKARADQLELEWKS